MQESMSYTTELKAEKVWRLAARRVLKSNPGKEGLDDNFQARIKPRICPHWNTACTRSGEYLPLIRDQRVNHLYDN